MLGVIPIIIAAHAPALATAYSWNFQAAPQQCGDVTVNLSGSDGSPPYRILIIPFGPTPFSNGTEVRRITERSFDGDSTSITFELNYPANSQFVAVVSDSSRFGSGGTSVAASVTTSDNSSCFDASQSVSPPFTFSIEPPNQIVQCQSTRIWWDPSTVEGTPNFVGVIPGGQSFSVPQGDISQVPSQGTGFSWTPNVRGGTTLLLIGGDNRGNGTGGSVLNTVSSGTSNDNSCLNDSSPSSTAGDPAGGSYPTNSDGASTGGGNSGNSGSSGNNVGAIVGGVIGGVVGGLAIALLLFFFRRRSKVQKQQREKQTVDLLNEDDEDEHGHAGNRPAELPQYYQPEPFVVPEPSTTSESGRITSYAPTSRSGTPDPLSGVGSSSTTTRKSAAGPRQLRPVNIIQHDDAGPSEGLKEEDEPETIELPPAYNKIHRTDSGTPIAGTTEATGSTTAGSSST